MPIGKSVALCCQHHWHTESITNGRNFAGYSNPRVDELFDKGRLVFDRDERAKIYAEIDRLIYGDQPFTILLYQPSLWAFSRAVRGYRPSPKGFSGTMPGFHSIWKKKGEAGAASHDPLTGLLVGLLVVAGVGILVYVLIRATSRPARTG